jgi:hypothetical protein
MLRYQATPIRRSGCLWAKMQRTIASGESGSLTNHHGLQLGSTERNGSTETGGYDAFALGADTFCAPTAKWKKEAAK